jgi:CRISPR-associated protein Cmr4
MNAKLIFVHALSPLHAGTGQGVGVIDLPIAREKATGIPYLPGSSLKGPLRDLCPDNTPEEKQKKKAVFGPDPKNDLASEHAGAAQFSDQRLLLLPVRSLKGTFAWVTSPYLLQRLARDAKSANPDAKCEALPKSLTGKQCVVTTNSTLTYPDSKGKTVVLEDLELENQARDDADKWAKWIGGCAFNGDADLQNLLKGRLCIVADDVLVFLLNTATEITARIRLEDDKKTVERGALWYEEALPTETVLCGLLAATEVKATGMTKDKVGQIVETVIEGVLKQHNPVQLGGKATVGRGVCYVRTAAVPAAAAQGGKS